jgi:hypothetical protein
MIVDLGALPALLPHRVGRRKKVENAVYFSG